MKKENLDKLISSGSNVGELLMERANALAPEEGSWKAEQMLQAFSRYIPRDFTVAQKAQLLFDVIVRQIQYANDWEHNQTRFTWYSALVDKRAVCEGISELFFQLCRCQGIPCRIIHGVGGEGPNEELHAWNMIRLEDGCWYHLDATWSLGGDQRTSYKFFLKSASYMKANGNDRLPCLLPDAHLSMPEPPPFRQDGVRFAISLWDRTLNAVFSRRK